MELQEATTDRKDWHSWLVWVTSLGNEKAEEYSSWFIIQHVNVRPAVVYSRGFSNVSTIQQINATPAVVYSTSWPRQWCGLNPHLVPGVFFYDQSTQPHKIVTGSFLINFWALSGKKWPRGMELTIQQHYVMAYNKWKSNNSHPKSSRSISYGTIWT